MTSKRQSATTFDPGRLNNLLNFIPDFIAYLNTNLVYEYVNRNYEIMLGIKAKDIIGKSIEAVFGEKMLTKIITHFEVARNGNSVTYNNSMVDKLGKQRIIKAELIPDKAQNGEVIGIVSMGIDITEYERMKDEAGGSALELEGQRNMFYDLFMNAPGYILLLRGPELRFELANPQVKKLAGNHIELGRPLSEVIPEFAAQGIEESLREAYDSGQPYESRAKELILHKSEGGVMTRYFDYCCQPYFNADGERDGLAVYATDVTDSVLAKKMLEEQSRPQKILLECIPQIAWTSTAEDIMDYHNQHWFEYTGMGINEVKEKGWQPIIHPDDLLMVRKHWDQARQEQELYEFEFRIKKAADKKYYWHLLRTTPVRNEKGEIQMWVGTATNIHDQITFQQKLMHSQEQLEEIVADRTAEINNANRELMEKNRELNRFAYVISHDLKAPLRGIRSVAKWLYEDYKDALGEEGQGQLNLLMQRVKKLHNLIESILQYSRADRDMDEESQQVDMKDVISEVLDNLAIPEHIKVAVTDKPMVIKFQKTKIYQVIQNLISNAIKFNNKEEGKIDIDFREKDEEYLISISDNGIGISKKYHDHIFLLFQTLSDEGDSESTGVGLAIVKKIIESLGGEIWLKSEEGKGATFYFTIPKHPVKSLEGYD